MKKIFVIFILAILMPCASVWAATVGAGCSYRVADDMVDGESRDVPCRDLKIPNAKQCFVYCEKGMVYKGLRDCNSGWFRLEPVSGVDGMFEKCGSLKEACESYDSKNSGASWDNVYNTCVCPGNSYAWNKNTMRCEKSDEYTKCNAVSGAEWDPQGGYCWCKDADKLWYNGGCHTRSEKLTCDDIIRNLTSVYRGSIRWNSPGTRCECVAGKIAADGEKIENPDDYYIGYIWDYVYIDADGVEQTKRIDGTVCYLKDSVSYRRGVGRIADSDTTQKTRKNIKEKYDALAGISKDWEKKKSHWKTASGNFNGARLASDSVAGVVLGTVGGVITSNVIKKNQIKGGFEDLNCTIGGQRVADYNDQFSVGIQ
ncbi:MAG: hypothetical protein NC311_03330 [Muribaculaceae bacterium]|nr:hypothetical protein [Muribaculaceae bacterium]